MLGAGVWSLVAAALVSSSTQTVWQYALLRHPIRPVLALEALPGGLRLRDAPIRRVPDGPHRRQPGHLRRRSIASMADVGQYSRGVLPGLPAVPLLPGAGADGGAVAPSQPRSGGRARLRRAYLSMLMLGSIVVFPVCAGVAVAAPELVRVLLGPAMGPGGHRRPVVRRSPLVSASSRRCRRPAAEARADLNRFACRAVSIRRGARRVPSVRDRLSVARNLGDSRGGPCRRARAGTSVTSASCGEPRVLRRTVVGVVCTGRRSRPSGVTLAIWANPSGARRAGADSCWCSPPSLPPGALMLALCIRFCPLPAIRRELRMRLDAAGMLGDVAAGDDGWRRWSSADSSPHPSRSHDRAARLLPRAPAP